MYGAVVVFYETILEHNCGKEMREGLNIPDEVMMLHVIGPSPSPPPQKPAVHTTGTSPHEQVHMFAVSLALLLLLQSFSLCPLPSLHISQHTIATREVSDLPSIFIGKSA